MGKPYNKELDQLGETYAWARKVPVKKLAEAVASMADLPLLAVGSGGSFSNSHHVGHLHAEFSGLVSKAITPLDFIRSKLRLGDHGVIIVSAGGSNPDILATLKHSINRDARRSVVVCLRPQSPLSVLAGRFQSVELVQFSPPVTSDGFLATNSLFALAVLFERAYREAGGVSLELPEHLAGLFSSAGSLDRHRRTFRRLLNSESILILSGTETRSAAVDLESKFSEAALTATQVVDFRHFAHGRHNWVAKRASETGILALYSAPDQAIARATLKLLPRDAVIANIGLGFSGVGARLAAFVLALYFVRDLAENRGVDPGRPGIPEFGRRIYRLRIPADSGKASVSTATAAIARKSRSVPHGMERGATRLWMIHLSRFVAALRRERFVALITDFDGTLCAEDRRFDDLSAEVVSALLPMLNAGIAVGIATGRGRSVRECLRRALPEDLWGRVLVGYYSGAELIQLSDDSPPRRLGNPGAALTAAAAVLAIDPTLKQLAEIEIRPRQISVFPRRNATLGPVWSATRDCVVGCRGVKVFRSRHSIDVLERRTSKRQLRDCLARSTGSDNILSLGDLGRWPGNDCELLAAPFSLSVDEVSAAGDTCWNLAPVGIRGVQATLHYLRSIRIGKGHFSFDIRKLGLLEVLGE